MNWTILVVDENRDFLNQLNQAIELAKESNPFNLKLFQVPSIILSHAEDGKTAFRNIMRLHETGGGYKLVILAQELPGDWDGLETLVRLGKLRPAPNCLLRVDNLKQLDREMIRKAWETAPFHLLMRPRSAEELRLYLTHAFFNLVWEKQTTENPQKVLPPDHRAERLQELLVKRKEENQELVEKLTDLQQAFNRKSEYLTVMSHEIRTPLSSILGMVEILQVSNLDGKQKEIAAALLDSSESLLSLINDILDMAKIEAGKMTLDLQPFHLEKWIASIFQMIQEKATKNGNKLEYYLDPNLPQVLIGDRDKLRQILINLLNNANKHTQNGKVKLAIDLQQNIKNEINLEFKVSDTGKGIPSEKLKNLFKPFTQITKPDSNEMGTGLGLVVCKRLVEMMAGTIGVQSREGLGSTFLFTATLGLYDGESPTDQPREMQPVPLSEPQKAGQTILVVEDNPTNLKVAHIHLAQTGYNILTAENGEVALDQLKHNEVDLVLMDLQMPVMDGFEATRRIRTDLGLKIPIIALTANVFGEHRTRCFEIGMDDFIPKPIRRKNFLGVISKWLGQAKHDEDGEDSSEVSPVQPQAEENQSDQNEPINYARAVREFEGDQDLVREVLRQFLINTELKMPVLARFVFETEYQDLEDQAHALKGGGGNLCADPFAFAARDLEEAAAAKDPYQVLLAFMNLQRSFGSLKEYCRTHPKLKL